VGALAAISGNVVVALGVHQVGPFLIVSHSDQAISRTYVSLSYLRFPRWPQHHLSKNSDNDANRPVRSSCYRVSGVKKEEEEIDQQEQGRIPSSITKTSSDMRVPFLPNTNACCQSSHGTIMYSRRREGRCEHVVFLIHTRNRNNSSKLDSHDLTPK
jgi:hypothetical protein